MSGLTLGHAIRDMKIHRLFLTALSACLFLFFCFELDRSLSFFFLYFFFLAGATWASRHVSGFLGGLPFTVRTKLFELAATPMKLRPSPWGNAI
jgi:hypothetical protein